MRIKAKKEEIGVVGGRFFTHATDTHADENVTLYLGVHRGVEAYSAANGDHVVRVKLADQQAIVDLVVSSTTARQFWHNALQWSGANNTTATASGLSQQHSHPAVATSVQECPLPDPAMPRRRLDAAVGCAPVTEISKRTMPLDMVAKRNRPRLQDPSSSSATRQAAHHTSAMDRGGYIYQPLTPEMMLVARRSATDL